MIHITATSRRPRRSCSGRTPTPSSSPGGSARTTSSADIDYWDARDGGSWRYTAGATATSHRASAGASTAVSPERIVQTFTWEGMPDGVALETLTFEDLGDGRTRLHATSRCATRFEARDGWLASGMEIGVNDGYAALDGLLEAGEL